MNTGFLFYFLFPSEKTSRLSSLSRRSFSVRLLRICGQSLKKLRALCIPFCPLFFIVPLTVQLNHQSGLRTVKSATYLPSTFCRENRTE